MTAAILLAAGRSRRMGTQKLLLPYAGRTIIGHIASVLAQCPLSPIIAVLGADRDAVSAALAGVPITFVTNPDPDSDMLTSVRIGLRAVPNTCDSILLALGDQPTITPALILNLLAAFRDGNRPIIVPTYNGQRGHPLLFSTAYHNEILTHHDDTGLRGLLRAHPADVHELPVADPSVLADLDTPEDYHAALR